MQCWPLGNHRNVTVYHDGAAHFDVDANKEQRLSRSFHLYPVAAAFFAEALVIYPFRVVGPATVDFDTRRGISVLCDIMTKHGRAKPASPRQVQGSNQLPGQGGGV